MASVATSRASHPSARVVELETLLELPDLPHRFLQDASIEVGEVGERHDVRVARGREQASSAPMLSSQAKELHVFERIVPGANLFGGDALRLARRFEPLDAVRC